MYQPLVSCPSCHRHVRATEAQCPFCAVALPADLAGRVIPAAPMRMSRAAAFVFGASLAVTGCGSEIDTGGSGTATGGNTTSGSSSGGSLEDGGIDAGPGPDDDGGLVAMYGDPPPLDAGPDDDGGGSADYGAPP